MINTLELKAKLIFFEERRFLNSDQMELLEDFIDYIDDQQKEMTKASVIPMEKREGMRRLKELKERQEENKRITPEEDFINIKD
jgi:hypothetical protein